MVTQGPDAIVGHWQWCLNTHERSNWSNIIVRPRFWWCCLKIHEWCEVSFRSTSMCGRCVTVRSCSLFQALGSWGRAKTSEKKNEGGLRRGVLPHFFSRSPFFFARPQLPRAWNRLEIVAHYSWAWDILLVLKTSCQKRNR